MGEDPKGFFGFLMMAVVPLLIFFHYLDIKKRKSTKIEQIAPTSDEWEYGDEWKNVEDIFDPTLWQEILTVPQGYSRLYDKGVPNLKPRGVDLVHIQTLMTENQIPSKILPSSRSTSPGDALFVELKNVDKAKRILETSESS